MLGAQVEVRQGTTGEPCPRGAGLGRGSQPWLHVRVTEELLKTQAPLLSGSFIPDPGKQKPRAVPTCKLPYKAPGRKHGPAGESASPAASSRCGQCEVGGRFTRAWA